MYFVFCIGNFCEANSHKSMDACNKLIFLCYCGRSSANSTARISHQYIYIIMIVDGYIRCDGSLLFHNILLLLSFLERIIILALRG